jgi:hypothetical protein
MKKLLLTSLLLCFALNTPKARAELSNQDINYISAAVGAVGGFFVGSGLTTPSAEEMIIGSIVLGGGYLASEEYGKKRSAGEDFARALVPHLGEAIESRVEWGIKGALGGALFGAIVGVFSREQREEKTRKFNDNVRRTLLEDSKQ